jgi:hypothetical protein
MLRLKLMSMETHLNRLWTQGSTRIYKSIGGVYSEANTIVAVGNQSLLVSIPDPVKFVLCLIFVHRLMYFAY